MYQTLKNLVPKALLNTFKPQLRQLVSVFYKGNAFVCNLCKFKMSRFISLDTGDLLCPKCGSLGRTRRLWQVLEKETETAEKMLHFSPPETLRSKLSQLKGRAYITTDYADEFNADKSLNIENIDEADSTYELIICYHVLEHVENDSKAMKELYRILKPGGKCLIQTPFKEGEIYENSNLKTEEERLEHFGQKDHLRIYSVDGLSDRLSAAGFRIEKLDFVESDNNQNGFKLNESILVCRKPL